MGYVVETDSEPSQDNGETDSEPGQNNASAFFWEVRKLAFIEVLDNAASSLFCRNSCLWLDIYSVELRVIFRSPLVAAPELFSRIQTLPSSVVWQQSFCDQ